MSDHDKMVAFGRWLISMQAKYSSELFDLSINRATPPAAIRIKAGHVEASGFILNAFRELYNGELDQFLKERLGIDPDDDHPKESYE